MTRDGLVEKNLNDQTTVRVSSRTGDLKLERKEKSGRNESLRAVHLARDEPVAGQKIRSRHRTVTPEKPQRKEKNVWRERYFRYQTVLLCTDERKFFIWIRDQIVCGTPEIR